MGNKDHDSRAMLTAEMAEMLALKHARKDDTHSGQACADGQPTSQRLHEPVVSNGCIHRQIIMPSKDQAVNFFLSTTVVQQEIDGISRGHLAGLVALRNASSNSAPLSHALNAVALASYAYRYNAFNLHLDATREYCATIRKLRKIDLLNNCQSTSTIACIVLLGIYEILSARTDGVANWLHHFRGITCILKHAGRRHQVASSALYNLVLGTEAQLQECNKQYHNAHLSMSQPSPPRFGDMCSIVSQVQLLFRKSAHVLGLHALRYAAEVKTSYAEAVALRSELLMWSSYQMLHNGYKTRFYFTQAFVLRFPDAEDLFCPSLHADIYQDYITACMWTTYRQCQLHLINLQSRLGCYLSNDVEAFCRGKEYAKLCKESASLAKEASAAIPFILLDRHMSNTKPTGSLWAHSQPPLLLGGLNLQWLLFTISILDIISPDTQTDMKQILHWIGKNLGIGQAAVLAKARSISSGVYQSDSM